MRFIFPQIANFKFNYSTAKWKMQETWQICWMGWKSLEKLSERWDALMSLNKKYFFLLFCQQNSQASHKNLFNFRLFVTSSSWHNFLRYSQVIVSVDVFTVSKNLQEVQKVFKNWFQKNCFNFFFIFPAQ